MQDFHSGTTVSLFARLCSAFESRELVCFVFQKELEKLNKASEEINCLEVELDVREVYALFLIRSE